MNLHPKIRAAALTGILVTALQGALAAVDALHLASPYGAIIAVAATLFAGYRAPGSSAELTAPARIDDAAQ